MEIVRVTEDRIEQLLPSYVKESCLSDDAKRVLATLINYFSIVPLARKNKRLNISNQTLREAVGIKTDSLINAIQELKECDLITRKAGKKWTKGERATASEYTINVENLRKPIVKPTTDELLDELFGSDENNNSTPTIGLRRSNDGWTDELNKMFN